MKAAGLLFYVSFLYSEPVRLQKCMGRVKKIHKTNTKRMVCFVPLDSPPENYSKREC